MDGEQLMVMGYSYGLIFGGPSGEQMEPETINDALPAGCSACWDGGAGGILA